MLVEHYEELLDAIVYIKTLILQRKQNAEANEYQNKQVILQFIQVQTQETIENLYI